MPHDDIPNMFGRGMVVACQLKTPFHSEYMLADCFQ